MAEWAYQRGLHKPSVRTVIDAIATDISQVFREDYRTDKNGIVHGAIGKLGFQTVAVKENLEALLGDLRRAKPATAKGTYVKKVTLSTTMGPGLVIDQSSLEA